MLLAVEVEEIKTKAWGKPSECKKKKQEEKNSNKHRFDAGDEPQARYYKEEKTKRKKGKGDEMKKRDNIKRDQSGSPVTDQIS